MPHEFQLGADDLTRVRFAVSPLWETTQAIRTLIDARQRPYHLPWLDEIRPRLDQVDAAPGSPSSRCAATRPT